MRAPLPPCWWESANSPHPGSVPYLTPQTAPPWLGHSQTMTGISKQDSKPTLVRLAWGEVCNHYISLHLVHLFLFAEFCHSRARVGAGAGGCGVKGRKGRLGAHILPSIRPDRALPASRGQGGDPFPPAGGCCAVSVQTVAVDGVCPSWLKLQSHR